MKFSFTLILVLFVFTLMLEPCFGQNNQPQVQVLTPNSGEIWGISDQAEIRWLYIDDDGQNDLANSRIELYTRNGGWRVIEVIDGPSTHFTWEVCDDVCDSCLIRVTVTDQGGLTARDRSDGEFEIQARPPSVSVLYPNGFEALVTGDRIEVSWEVSDLDEFEGIGEIDYCIAYYFDGDDWEEIGRTQNYHNSYDFDVEWEIPETPSSSKISVRAYDIHGLSGYDESDEDFSIVDSECNRQHLAAGWSMISIPVIPRSRHINWVFGDDYIRQYVLYGFTPERGQFPVEEIELGQGYIIGTAEWAEVDVDTFTYYVDDTFEFDLSRGWNMLGTPYSRPVPLSESEVIIGRHDPMSFERASLNGYIAPVGYNFFHNMPTEHLPGDSLQRYYTHDILLPWRGYWYIAYIDSVRLVLSRPDDCPTDPDPIPERDEANQPDVDNWHLELLAIAGSSADECRLGCKPSATDGMDRIYDWLEPPHDPGMNPLTMHFKHAGWNFAHGSEFTSDIRNPFHVENTKVWQISIGGAENDVIVRWDAINRTTPDNFEFTLIDGARNRTIDMRQCESYTFEGGESHRFEIRAYNALSVRRKNDKIPTHFNISSVYPNPFNNSTKIGYAIPEAGFVTINIVDISGRIIQELANRWIGSGNYSINWNADEVSPGMYFVVMSNEKEQRVKKIVLIK